MLTQIYHSSFISAVLDVFPDIGLEKHQFKSSMSSIRFLLSPNHLSFLPNLIFGIEKHWADETNQKNFFFAIAEEVGFDPAIAQNWYTIPIQTFENRPVCISHSHYASPILPLLSLPLSLLISSLPPSLSLIIYW